MEGSLLAGRPVARRQLGDAVSFWLPCAADEALACWHAARALRDETGRQPLLLAPDDQVDWLLNDEAVVARRCADAAAVDVEAVTRELAVGWWPEASMQERLHNACAESSWWCGAAPDPADVAAAAQPDWTFDDVEEWFLRWEAAHAPAVDPMRQQRGDAATAMGVPYQLHLLPTGAGWQALGYVTFFPAQEAEDVFCALAREWEEVAGAEATALYGSVLLDFHVSRPVTDLDVAWRLAAQLGPYNGNNGLTRRHLAASLIGADGWGLFSRP